MGLSRTLTAEALGKLDESITMVVGLGAREVGSRGMRCHPTNRSPMRYDWQGVAYLDHMTASGDAKAH